MSPLKEAFNKLTTGDSLGGEESQPQIPKGVEKPPSSPNPPRFLIIGAGSRGRAYAECIVKASNGVVSAVAEPIAYKRDSLGQKYIWGEAGQPSEGQTFANWKEFVDYETERRRRADAGDDNVPPASTASLSVSLMRCTAMSSLALRHSACTLCARNPSLAPSPTASTCTGLSGQHRTQGSSLSGMSCVTARTTGSCAGCWWKKRSSGKLLV